MGEIFPLERSGKAMAFTGERFTSAESGQIEIEHIHRYFLARHFCRGKDVLDIASGEGYGAALLSQVASSVIGVDVADEAVEHAARNYIRDSLSFRKGDGSQLPISDSSVDVVVSFETIEHLYDHQRFLSEIRRVLRPGGLLILSCTNRHSICRTCQMEWTTNSRFHCPSVRCRPQARRLRRPASRLRGLTSATHRELGSDAIDGILCSISARGLNSNRHCLEDPVWSFPA
jgi:ubiquinone/menaquinone biosynthesis C-methylase UbiE